MLVSYLFGSVPFGKIIAARHHIDIQKEGSGNIGFANIYRVIGRRPAFLVLTLDILKGVLPALLATKYVGSLSAELLIAFTAVLGHVFPVWLRFKGGKGVATSLGIILVLLPPIGITSFAVYVMVLGRFRKFPLASLVAAVSLPISAAILVPEAIMFCLFLSFFCFWTHRSNIAKYRDLRNSTTA